MPGDDESEDESENEKVRREAEEAIGDMVLSPLFRSISQHTSLLLATFFAPAVPAGSFRSLPPVPCDSNGPQQQVTWQFFQSPATQSNHPVLTFSFSQVTTALATANSASPRERRTPTPIKLTWTHLVTTTPFGPLHPLHKHHWTVPAPGALPACF